MMLSCSRALFVRPVIRMDQTPGNASHVAAFEFFGGVPARLRPRLCGAPHNRTSVPGGVMCPTARKSSLALAVMGRVRAHNGQRESSQCRRLWSDRQTGVLRSPTEEVGGSQARRAASLVLVLISA